MLTVYRASAGAGKTHTLTGEYLSLLFRMPGAFRHILAVTFTNKATDEMKSRIVNELYNLASGKTSDYIQTLQATYSLTEKQIRTQAQKILIEVLHDYSAFHISTIDRFFQQTMRAFTREIGLHGGYGIEMDQELVLATAVDNLLADLDHPTNKQLLHWFLRFAEERIENGGEWNLRREIMALGREVFKEKFKASGNEVAQDIANKQLLESYRGELYKIIHATEFEIQNLGKEALYIMDQHLVKPSDFKGGSRSPLMLFERLAQGEMKEPTATFLKLVDNMDNYYTKTTPTGLREILKATVLDGLNDCVRGVIYLFEHLKNYYSAKEINRYFYTLGILTDISQQIAAYREEKNVMLIADTTELLNQIIGQSDTPFIYEKIGSRIDHYMIDEFQDTSNMQWNNFRPLLEESLAQGQSNLIVGDVKQSIYRFRNSDWELLDKQIRLDFSNEEIQEKTLADNWRSCPNIVKFNNAFFKTLPLVFQHTYNETLEASSLNEQEKALFATKIITAYAKSEQQIPPKANQQEGHVRIEFLSDDEEENGKNWREKALEQLPHLLEQLQDNGYALKDIAILVRTNQEGAQVADTLLTYKEDHPSAHYHYDLISDDALFISNAISVRFLVAILRFLKKPTDAMNKETVTYLYKVLKGAFGDEQITLPAETLFTLQTIAQQSLYEIVEELFRLFATDFPENEQIYIQAFLDMISEFVQKEHADLSLFLLWWDESGCKKTITTPNEQNAIRILTIHKSKGLGFKAVIIPFCDWEIDHKPNKQTILWSHPKEKPFNKLHLVPVRYTPLLSKTIFAKEYFDERLHTFIDNLNTLYVALTRPKEELFVFAPVPAKINKETNQTEKISSLADAMWTSLLTEMPNTEEGESLLQLPAFFQAGTQTFEIGSSSATRQTQEKKKYEEIGMTRLTSISSTDRLHLRLQSKGLFFDDPHRKYGTLMHKLLSNIRTQKDITQAINQYRQEGVIDEQEAQTLHARLSHLLNQPEVKPWYDEATEIKNEVSILFGNGLSKRPDRVIFQQDRVIVIDYKFGEQINPSHYQQINTYLKLIRQMGYQQVEGFLWYVELGKIEAIP